MRLSDIRHQDRAVSILRRSLRSGRVPHAYLFEGPAGVGKELTARALAARLLCLDRDRPPDADACGVCASCRLLAAGTHPDFHLIERDLYLHLEAAKRKTRDSSAEKQGNPPVRKGPQGLTLSVDVIRVFLIEPASLKPTQSDWRVFVVRDAEQMREAAQNALLKTLEEPPGHACLILVTSSATRLLPTIRSRCQQIVFERLPRDFVANVLRERGLDDETSHALASLAEGRVGVALRWHELGLLGQLETVADALDRLESPSAFAGVLADAADELGVTAVRLDQPDDEFDFERWTDEPGPPADDDEEGEEEEDEEDIGPAVRAEDVPAAVRREMYKLLFLLLGAVYRDALLLAAGAQVPLSVPQVRRQAAALAESGTDALERALWAINEAERMLERNVQPALTCERLAVALRGEWPVS